MSASHDENPTGPQPPVFDPNRLNSLMDLEEGGSNGAIVEIARLFLSDTAEMIDRFATAIEKGDFPQVAIGAHSIKGSSASFGLLQVGKAAKELEAAAKNSALEETQIHYEILRKAFEAGQPVLQSYLDAR